MYRKEHNDSKPSYQSVSAKVHAHLSNLHLTKTHLKIPPGGNNLNIVLYIRIASKLGFELSE